MRASAPQAGGTREAHSSGDTGGAAAGSAAAASVDSLVGELSEVVATHARSPLPLGELHRSLQTLTAKAAVALESSAAEPGASPCAAAACVLTMPRRTRPALPVYLLWLHVPRLCLPWLYLHLR